MWVSRRVILPIGASIFATMLIPRGAESRAQGASTSAVAGGGGAQATTESTAIRAATAADTWTAAAGELAAKILLHATPRDTVTLSLRNISSLADADVSQIRRAIRAQLRRRSVHLAGAKQASVEVQVTLSENLEGYIWVAAIRNKRSGKFGSGETTAPAQADASTTQVIMTALARPKPDKPYAAVEPLSIRRTLVYAQPEIMLDVAPLDHPSTGSSGPSNAVGAQTNALVLSLDTVSLFEKGDNGGVPWRLKQSAPLVRLHPWPRDPRGRLMIGPDNSFDVYLPGTKCKGVLEPALSLDCHEGDEPWPLSALGAFGAAAHFAEDRNFFDGRIRLNDGRELKTAPFYSAAAVALQDAGLPIRAGQVPLGATNSGAAKGGTSSASGTSWLLTGIDGRLQMLDANGESVTNIGGWGSELVGLETNCAHGWQVLASQAGDYGESDAVQAYAVVNRKAVAVSLPVEFPGPVTELWPLADRSAAIAIAHNLKAARYEAFRLSISCGQ